MNIEIYHALIELIKQGGTLALWGIAIWLVISLMKVLAICLVVYLVGRLISKTILGICKTQADFKATQVPLLSQAISGKLLQTLEDYHQSVNLLLRSLQEQLNRLNTASEKSTK